MHIWKCHKETHYFMQLTYANKDKTSNKKEESFPSLPVIQPLAVPVSSLWKHFCYRSLTFYPLFSDL